MISIFHHYNIVTLLSMDWFKGNSSGKPQICWENLWFPVDFPFNQSIDIGILIVNLLVHYDFTWIPRPRLDAASGSFRGQRRRVARIDLGRRAMPSRRSKRRSMSKRLGATPGMGENESKMWIKPWLNHETWWQIGIGSRKRNDQNHWLTQLGVFIQDSLHSCSRF